jgi:cell division protease FtsH
MKQRTIIIIAALLLLVGGWTAYSEYAYQAVPYTTFVEKRESGEVTSVTIKSDRLTYTLSESNTKYKTDNPSTPTLKEELLKEGISVKDETEDTLDSILNTLINIIFFGIIIFGIYKLISYSTSTFRVVRHTGVHFSDIAGMYEEKEEILSAVKALGKDRTSTRPVKGIILEGPPGNGKTLFARALAEECGVSFIAAKGADFQGAVMGLGAFKVKMLFSKARRRKPCIIFIDEFDSIGEKRNYAGSGIDKENNRILTTLLNEMDGFSQSSRILVIAATNSFESLDPALIRPGRFDLKFTVPNPDEKTRAELVKLYLKDTPLLDGLTESILVSSFNGLSSAAIEAVINEAKSLSGRKGMNGIDRSVLVEAARKTALKLNTKR